MVGRDRRSALVAAVTAVEMAVGSEGVMVEGKAVGMGVEMAAGMVEVARRREGGGTVAVKAVVLGW